MSAELLSSLASTEGDWHSPFREDSSKSKDDKEKEKNVMLTQIFSDP